MNHNEAAEPASDTPFRTIDDFKAALAIDDVQNFTGADLDFPFAAANFTADDLKRKGT